jgi:hypothetical protein
VCRLTPLTNPELVVPPIATSKWCPRRQELRGPVSVGGASRGRPAEDEMLVAGSEANDPHRIIVELRA